MDYLVIILYITCMFFVFVFSLGQLHLALLYKKSKTKNSESTVLEMKDLPLVTVQLPVYNEKYVVVRLLDAITSLEYPRDKLQIQVLDDSDDETSAIIQKKVKQYAQAGYAIEHLQRSERKGFKAGALQFGLKKADGEFIAIFDADFLPEPDFLRKLLPAFSDNHIGMVQACWGHINEDYSTLTRLQAFGLNAHFSVEQKGRNNAGSFINFNGTAGIWRKKCIEEAGGWSFDTLTEDLDLSYRAQLKGWKFKYMEEVVAPAELPILVPAIKSQQYRWNKGAAETARKNLWKVLTSNIKTMHKIHAFFHLFNSSVFLCLFLASLLSIPMLFIKFKNPELKVLFDLSSVFLIGFIAISYFYWISSKRFHPKRTFFFYITNLPLFLAFSMGLSFHNTVAVLEGIFGYKTPFIRTPKFNIKKSLDSWKGNIYIKNTLSWETIIEGLLFIYFVFGIVSGFYLADYGLMLFHIMLAVGFAGIFFFTLKNMNDVKRSNQANSI